MDSSDGNVSLGQHPACGGHVQHGRRLAPGYRGERKNCGRRGNGLRSPKRTPATVLDEHHGLTFFLVRVAQGAFVPVFGAPRQAPLLSRPLQRLRFPIRPHLLQRRLVRQGQRDQHRQEHRARNRQQPNRI